MDPDHFNQLQGAIRSINIAKHILRDDLEICLDDDGKLSARLLLRTFDHELEEFNLSVEVEEAG